MPKASPTADGQACLSKGDQPQPFLIPQRQPHGPQTLQQRYSPDSGELRMVAQHVRQAIAGNSTGQMMDVVDADVRREPSQDSRQLVMGAAVQRSVVKIPGLLMRPVCVLELVLDVKQPDTDRGRQNDDRQMYEQEGPV